MLWSVGDQGDVAARFTEHFASFLEALLPLGVVWEAGDADGAAVWIPPSRADAWQQAQLDEARVNLMTLDGLARYSAFWGWVESRLPSEPAWHLDSVGVDPSSRGRGTGSALIEHGLAMAREDHAAAVLETGNPHNVPYYERIGFDVVEAAEAPDGGPTVWFMRRDPAAG